MNKNTNTKAYIAATSYAVITGLSFLFTKIALDEAAPLDILAFRFTASFIAIILSLAFGWAKVDYNKEKIKAILPAAILHPLLFFSFQTFGLLHANSSEAGILLAISPVLTMILAEVFLKEKSTVIQKISIVVSVFGVAFVSIMKSTGAGLGQSSTKGVILLVLSAASFSGYSIIARKLRNKVTSIELSFMMNIISFVAFNVLAVGSHILNGSISTFLMPLSSISFVLSILYLGIPSSLLTATLTNYAFSKLPTNKISVFTNLGTVISIIAGVAFLQEKLYYYHIIGSVLIIAGILGANFLVNRK